MSQFKVPLQVSSWLFVAFHCLTLSPVKLDADQSGQYLDDQAKDDIRVDDSIDYVAYAEIVLNRYYVKHQNHVAHK